jgi:hypothetical protein
VTVWQIDGTARDGDDAWAVSVQTISPSPSHLPDYRRALAAARPGWVWSSVASVAVVTGLPDAWDARDHFAAALLFAAAAHDRERRVSESVTRDES